MFGFPKVQHKHYDRNFLKTVIFQVSFEKRLEILEKKEEIFEIFKASFPSADQSVSSGFEVSFSKGEKTPILQQINENPGLEMKSEDGQKIVSINQDSFSVTYNGVIYENFEKLIDDLKGLDDFFVKLGIGEVSKIAIRKINVIEFTTKGNPSDTMAYILSSALLSNHNYFPDSNYIKQNIKSVRYSKEMNHLNLKYGLNIPPTPNEDLGQIIIDIDMIELDKISKSAIFDRAKKINDEIFNVFSWAISENTKGLLNE